ncbi:MAG TPA: SDR family NAD(P)-dependent oxidoreductase, partial [Amycolatopsis sp.]
AVWGLGRVAALEYPQQWGGLVDLPATLDESAARTLVSVLAGLDGEDQVAVRSAGASGRRLVRYPVDELPGEFTASGSVLVTGGTGALGAECARWLADSGAENLILVSRRGEDAPGAAELRTELEALGARVDIVSCDVADRAELAAVLARVPAEHPLTGVVHTAGTGQQSPLHETDAETFAGIMSAKVSGAINLDDLLGETELDFFVLFASIAGVWGSGGQSAYAAGNAYLDALAGQRRTRGLAATSIAWGPWADAGMATDQAVSDDLARRGLTFLSPATAMAELRRAVAQEDVTVTVADVDWERYYPIFTSLRPSPLLGDLPEARAALAAEPDAAGSEFAIRLRAMAEPEQRRVLLDLVRTEAAVVLGHASAESVTERQSFRDAGFDSMTAVELRKRLAKATGLTLPATLAFDYPNPAALATFLGDEALGAVDALVPAATATPVDDDPIAIVGMSCRFPGGVRSPEQLWDLVSRGADAVTDFPADRGWDGEGLYDLDPDRPGRTYTTQGGFLHDAAEFDPGFFGISPREALAMDPQQRLLLETAWEVFERAGIDPETVHGSSTGTFIGASYQDYGAGADLGGSEGMMVTGTSPSVLSGRVAYLFGLEGPAVTVDTACSSSLVALHLACQSLRRGESSLALAGGAHIMANPGPFVAFSRQRALASDGRTKAFGDGADGMILAEGVGLVLVERLSDARRNGHPVLAVVRGSAINQDGASNGMTAPNGPSQQRVIRQALADAGLSTTDIDAVDGHGTGTALGDPIEAQALQATYGRDRDPEHPLLLGSIKTNIGHTQSAAGVASVIKMVMAMRHGHLPSTLNSETASPHIDWSPGTISLLNDAVGWPETGRPRRAAVSSFGISGTNAHTILEHVPEDVPAAVPEAPVGIVPLVLSGKSAAALRGQAVALKSVVDTEPDLRDLGYSLVTSRTLFEHRAVVLGSDHVDALSGLDALGRDGSAAGVISGIADVDGRRVFVFPGQGSQWAGMGARLLGESPVFAERMAECAAALSPFVDWSLIDVLRQSEGAPTLDRVDVVQPATWAVMVSLAALWRSRGVEPDAVVGHSQGEIAAAVVAGALSLSDGARVVALRSQAIGRTLAGLGGMMSIALPVEDVEARLSGRGAGISVAAVNGPNSVVVSGEPELLDTLFGELTAEEIRVRRIAVDYASHSAQVELLEEELSRVLAEVRPQASQVPFFSTVTGDWLDTTVMDAGYWYRNLRRRVEFGPAIAELVAQGHRVFIESSPHPVLTTPVQDVADAAGVKAVAGGSLRREQDTTSRFLTSLAEVFVRGVRVNWPDLFEGGRRIALPTYAFQRESFYAVPIEPEAASTVDAADAEFWNAVEEQDFESLSASLDVDGASLATVLPALSSWRRQRQDKSTVDSWRYRAAWKPVKGVSPAALSGTWLVVSAEGADDAELTTVLESHGAQAERLVLDETAMDREVLAARLNAFEGLSGVVSLLAFAEQPSELHPELALGLALSVSLVQALGDAGIDAPLWSLTRGAVSTGRSDQVPNPVQAQVAGLGWTAALEAPHRWGGVVDLPGSLDQRGAQRLVSVLAGTTGEDQLAIRSSGVLARRVVPAPAAEPDHVWTPRGTTLVTGGTGTLAKHLARWLAAQGAEHIVLTSRRGIEAPGAPELLAELTELGADAEMLACDVADRDSVAQLLADLKSAGRTVRTVVHTAAIIELSSIDGTDIASFARVIRAKVLGAQHLDELLDDEELDAFVLYSSTAGLWGSGLHAAYVAGNAYLAALAENRRARGLATTSISWGIWADDRELGRVDPEQIRRSGLVFMEPALALAGLRRALDSGDTAVAVADVDWARYHPVYTSVRPTELFAEVPEVRRLTEAAEETQGAVGEGEFAARLRSLPAAEQDRLLLDLVRGEAATVLGHDSADALSEQRAFRDVGFDSLTAVDLRNRLATATGLTLPSTMVFDYPSPIALAAFLRSEIAGAQVTTIAPTASGGDSDDPIVIIGMSCRYPGGVTSPEDLWDLVTRGADVISGFPADRGWDGDGLFDADPDSSGKTYSTQGGFLDDVAGFDPGFFGVSPREALAMDPQQRLLLETAWEAFERAGIDPAALRGSRTGTFVGASYQDYNSVGESAAESSEGHMITGTLSSILSGRISYLFGLEGPAVTLDTACSSSLVALHLACQSVRSGESSLALAGGVSVMSTPSAFVGFSRQRAMAPDGRCKAYAEAADGMSLAEGIGLVLVERLSDAVRNGHQVLAVVRGSAVNSDGASNGLTAPNGPSQQRVIRQALANSGLSASDIDVLEGHGTGTALGDPIEAQAILATYGQDRARPLLLGSVKSNIGHTQMASGVASVIKAVLAMRHGVVPKTLHIDEPSSHVDWSSGAIRLLTEQIEWPESGRPRRAGVSSFGLSGTNVHTLLEQAPASEIPVEEPADGVVPVLLSGRSDQALRDQAARVLSLLQARPELHPADLAFSLATTRSGFERRAAVVTADRDDLVRGLTALRDRTPATGLVQGTPARGRLAFLCTGQGSQRPGMGQELYERFEVFAEAFDAALACFDVELDRPSREIVFAEAGTPEAELLDTTAYTQPALFALEVGLFRLAESWGIRPDYLAGHSIGEIAAAHAAGVFSLEDACALVAARGRLMQALPEGGAMVSLEASEDEVTPHLSERVSIAAINGPAALVVSGDEEDVLVIAARFEADGRKTKRLTVSHAFHSPHMDAMLEEFAAVAAGITYHAPVIPLVSTVTGTLATAEQLCDPQYWATHVRGTVRFADGVAALAAEGVTTFAELGPDGVLSGMVQQVLGEEPEVVPALRRDRSEVTAVTTALSRLHVHGVSVDWAAFFAGSRARRIDLPTYPFQHERFWPEPGSPAVLEHTDPVDAEFWAAVEREDLGSLASTLDLDDTTITAMVPALSSWRRRRRDQSTVDEWRYRAGWKPLPAITDRAKGTWLVVTTPGADAWVDTAVDGLGAATVRFEVTETDRALLAEQLGQLGTGFAGVLSLVALDNGTTTVPAGLTLTATLVQALGDAGITAPLWCVTRGAVAIGQSEQVTDSVQAGVWGFGRVVALEHPDRWGGLVDLPVELDQSTASRLASVVAGVEDQVAVRASGAFVRRLAHRPSGGQEIAPFTPSGTVLVTGGTGALGAHVARWLAEGGAEHVVLLSRRGPDAPGAAALQTELTGLGAEVTI